MARRSRKPDPVADLRSESMQWHLGNAWCFVCWLGPNGDRDTLLFVGTSQECFSFGCSLPSGTWRTGPWAYPFVEFGPADDPAPWLAAKPPHLLDVL